jgi:hypothetical protein
MHLVDKEIADLKKIVAKQQSYIKDLNAKMAEFTSNLTNTNNVVQHNHVGLYHYSKFIADKLTADDMKGVIMEKRIIELEKYNTKLEERIVELERQYKQTAETLYGKDYVEDLTFTGEPLCGNIRTIIPSINATNSTGN